MGDMKFEFNLEFTLGRDLTGPEFDALYEAGFDNSLIITTQSGVYSIDITWKAATKAEAITKAKVALKRTIPNAIIRVG